MLKNDILKWIDALKSGKYEKGSCYLRTTDNKYRCLGVLCDIEGIEVHSQDELSWSYMLTDLIPTRALLPLSLQKKYGLTDLGKKDEYESLTSVNDSNLTFEPVIEHIKKIFAKELSECDQNG